MKRFIYIIVFMGVVFSYIAGCSNTIVNEEQFIEVQKRIGDETKYEEFKVITDNGQVEKVKDILNNIAWENAKVEMSRPPDYRFIIKYTNPQIEAKAVSYELWVSPNKDIVTLVISAENKYIHLDKNRSVELFEIFTGKKLLEQKL